MLKAAYRHAERLVRDADRDRWLASLFADSHDRPHLHAILAFNLEIARVREVVREPLPGEMRLQWWRDVIEGRAKGDVESHPVARALLDTIDIYRLPDRPFLDLIEARTFDLYDDPMPSLHDLEGYAGETTSTLFQLGAVILNKGAHADTADAAGHAGVAYALTGLMRALAHHARRGQVYLPLDMLAANGISPHDVRSGLHSDGLRRTLADLRERARMHVDAARSAMTTVPRHVQPVFLPVALTPMWLDYLEAADPFDAGVEIPLWRRQWLLWNAARRARGGRPMF
ncbi:phytoene/squalene synthase family protein [Methylobrevis pamukkalensis]|uniref:All-trans-phytoene synthase n=1 Tax=Methylobrevis pamukkalensis TaxID=1439726 RepID=A0A1E3H1S7_9HYPH|nr:phytoene/squalene synthase family protein [Methylobrevis pamukkalensis]ODN69746.1 All-trans-phytoene synthase [Methylobrevis pamukkalensis]